MFQGYVGDFFELYHPVMWGLFIYKDGSTFRLVQCLNGYLGYST